MTGLCQKKGNLNHVCLLTENWKNSLVNKFIAFQKKIISEIVLFYQQVSRQD